MFANFKKAIEQLGKPCSMKMEDLFMEWLGSRKIFFADTGNSGADDIFCTATAEEARACVSDFFMEDIADPDHPRTEENCCTIVDMTETFNAILEDWEAESASQEDELFEE